MGGALGNWKIEMNNSKQSDTVVKDLLTAHALKRRSEQRTKKGGNGWPVGI